jgi:hypothetical protein
MTQLLLLLLFIPAFVVSSEHGMKEQSVALHAPRLSACCKLPVNRAAQGGRQGAVVVTHGTPPEARCHQDRQERCMPVIGHKHDVLAVNLIGQLAKPAEWATTAACNKCQVSCVFGYEHCNAPSAALPCT